MAKVPQRFYEPLTIDIPKHTPLSKWNKTFASRIVDYVLDYHKLQFTLIWNRENFNTLKEPDTPLTVCDLESLHAALKDKKKYDVWYDFNICYFCGVNESSFESAIFSFFQYEMLNSAMHHGMTLVFNLVAGISSLAIKVALQNGHTQALYQAVTLIVRYVRDLKEIFDRNNAINNNNARGLLITGQEFNRLPKAIAWCFLTAFTNV